MAVCDICQEKGATFIAAQPSGNRSRGAGVEDNRAGKKYGKKTTELGRSRGRRQQSWEEVGEEDNRAGKK